MNLAEAVQAATADPSKGFRREGRPGLYFIDASWFERGWLAFSHSSQATGGWSPSLTAWEAAQTDWRVVKLPAKLRRDIGEQYADPLSAKRTRRSHAGKA
jgi:hypothetical protein